jgi:hypothetical protein
MGSTAGIAVADRAPRRPASPSMMWRCMWGLTKSACIMFRAVQGRKRICACINDRVAGTLAAAKLWFLRGRVGGIQYSMRARRLRYNPKVVRRLCEISRSKRQ